jgi:hypothetical protein
VSDALDAENDAELALLITVPTTLAGVAAVLEHMNHHEFAANPGGNLYSDQLELVPPDKPQYQAAIAWFPMIARVLRHLDAQSYRSSKP